MNIKQAKEQIKNAITAYFTKDEFGSYIIPIERQRPIFMMGAPGIGKTAVMEQIAEELDVALVSYSMTHHTRQSALGLPFIVEKEYGGEKYSISEYTMSEIIASVYDTIEKTGKKEGILFLDEINCVSETLAPAMLQFLQYKIFGRHRVPDGWIVVTAGNPPEYNNSVREFDIVTWDRLKRVDVEPDYEVWKEYAYKKGTHAAILTYLDIKKSDFYKIETTVDGKSFVTARGWSDLSDMIKLYEKHGIKVDETLVAQYLQNKKIAKDFAIYYDLWGKYKSDYQVDKILDGKADKSIVDRAKAAAFDERLSLLGLLLDGVTEPLRNVCIDEQMMTELLTALKSVKIGLARPGADAKELLEKQSEALHDRFIKGKLSSSISQETSYVLRLASAELSCFTKVVVEAAPKDGTAAFAVIKAEFDKRTKELKKIAADAGKELENAFVFCENAFGDGQEMLIFVTELTISYYGAHFISRYGCPKYFEHNKELLFYERQKELIREIEKLDLED
ncbi:MAG: AAA family ATPase [Clostridia bacterium]|nr:AAA family ATPase [Clostridia bacterium]